MPDLGDVGPQPAGVVEALVGLFRRELHHAEAGLGDGCAHASGSARFIFAHDYPLRDAVLLFCRAALYLGLYFVDKSDGFKLSGHLVVHLIAN